MRAALIDSRLGLDPVHDTPLLPGSSTRLFVGGSSPVTFTGDCIVNAANPKGLGGGGVDGAINAAGGAELGAARRRLPLVQNPHLVPSAPGDFAFGGRQVRIPVGSAVSTGAGDLPCRHVIHAVGPHFGKFPRSLFSAADALLADAYSSAMAEAERLGAASIAFSLLSAGVFRSEKSLRKVLEIGVRVVRASGYEGLKEVHFVAFLQDEMDELVSLCEAGAGEDGRGMDGYQGGWEDGGGGGSDSDSDSDVVEVPKKPRNA